MNPLKQNKVEDYVGVAIKDNYTITEFINKGMISLVFKVIDETGILYACKVIPKENIKQGWKVEINKIRKLDQISGVILCYEYGTSTDHKGKSFNWVLLNYVPGINLKEFILKRPFPLDLPFIERLSSTILKVLFACNVKGFPHGDLHEGNILISEPNETNENYERDIWVTDFGYGGSQSIVKPKNDISHFTSIVNNLLDRLNVDDLIPMQKILYAKMRVFLKKRISEKDPLQGDFVNNFRGLITEFNNLHQDAQKEHESIGRGEHMQDAGDYLNAESFGESIEEWKSLFVPGFLGVRDLLSLNTAVLTGARGCGKTMAFKRLTVYMDKIIGEPLQIPTVNAFCGFYLNSSYLKDAFPYAPEKIGQSLNLRLIHFFHLAWTAEILKTIAAFEDGNKINYQWLDKFYKQFFKDRYKSTDIGANILAHVMSFTEDEKEFCRFFRYEEGSETTQWYLSRLDYLDELVKVIQKNVGWALNRPFFFFLDDYTIPTIPRRIQRIYNDIIFRRSDRFFFKVSTEAVNSYEPFYSSGKPIQLNHDLTLIDLAAESIWLNEESKKKLIKEIFDRRIQRDKYWKDKSLTIEIALGKFGMSNNALAKKMRSEVKTKIQYYGFETFVGIWSSDIRSMVQIFAAMLRARDNERASGEKNIPNETQDNIYQIYGGDFLKFTEQAPNPNDLEKSGKQEESQKFGKHLKGILQAFIDISKNELMKGKLIKNQGRTNPKQAFRIEILDDFVLIDPNSEMYLDGLLRWHIFLADRRANSIRGAMNNRYFMNRLMIPHAKLTFSKHDHIHLNSKQFEELLLTPNEFVKNYIKTRKENSGKGKIAAKKKLIKNQGQIEIFKSENDKP